MTKEEIDILWQKAMQESIKDGEMFTRYHFAKLVAEKEREELLDIVYSHAANLSWNEDFQNAIEARGQA